MLVNFMLFFEMLQNKKIYLYHLFFFVVDVIVNGKDKNAWIAATTDDTPVAIIGENICPKAIEFNTTDSPQSK